MLTKKPISLANDHLVDQSFKCWKTCCKKQGVQVSTCEQNSCQKCCSSECSDIKSIIKTRRKFSSESCNQCLQKKCNHQNEYTSVITSRSCRGLFNKYTTPFNSSVTFQVEANRDLRIFLYDEPLNLIRQSLRKRRNAELMDDILDDTEASERFEREALDLVDQIHARVRRSMDEQRKREKEMKQKAKEVKISEREKLKEIRKKKRTNKRKRKQEIRQAEKQKYGLNPGKKTKPESVAQIQHDVFLHDFVFEEPEEVEEYETNQSIEEARESRQRQEYEYESEYGEEPAELGEAPIDCRDHITDKATLKACNQEIKALYKKEKERLRKMSATYRKLKPALDNPLVVTQAIEKTKNQISQMGNDAINAMSSEEMAEKDDALTRYLNMYGYNDDNAADGVFQTVFKNNAQEIYAEQKAAQQSTTLDRADWTRPHILREVPLQTLGSLYVNDQKNRDEVEREQRKLETLLNTGVSQYGRSVRLAPGKRNGVTKL